MRKSNQLACINIQDSILHSASAFIRTTVGVLANMGMLEPKMSLKQAFGATRLTVACYIA